VSVGGNARDRLEHRLLHVWRDRVSPGFAEALVLVEYFGDDSLHRRTSERRFPGEHLIGHRTKGIYV
jgi:hypothetical protein